MVTHSCVYECSRLPVVRYYHENTVGVDTHKHLRCQPRNIFDPLQISRGYCHDPDFSSQALHPATNTLLIPFSTYTDCRLSLTRHLTLKNNTTYTIPHPHSLVFFALRKMLTFDDLTGKDIPRLRYGFRPSCRSPSLLLDFYFRDIS